MTITSLTCPQCRGRVHGAVQAGMDAPYIHYACRCGHAWKVATERFARKPQGTLIKSGAAASILGISRRRFHDWLEAGIIPAPIIRSSGRGIAHLFDVDEIIALRQKGVPS